MPATKKGIYHNLKESEYTISNKEIVFSFSSQLYMKKFLDTYKERRKHIEQRMKSLTNYKNPLNYDSMSDLYLYQEIEKRGFLVRIKGVEMSWQECHLYALRKMTDQNSLNWSIVQKAK